MQKNIFVRIFLIIAVFLLSLDCSSSKKNKTVVSSDDLTVTTFTEMNNGIYIGGGMLYNSAKSQYNHFDDLNTVSIRLSTLKKVELSGDVISTTYDAATGAQLTQTSQTSMDKTEEIASSVLVGQIGIKSISDTGITLACKLVDVNGDTAVTIDNATVLTGNGYDLNGDGFNDIEYLDYDTDNVNGMAGTKILVFNSDADALKVTMYKSPTDTDYKFPSGIITITPSNNVMVKMSNLSLDSSSTLSMNGNTSQCFSFKNSGLPTLTQYDYIYDDTNSKMYVINETPAIETNTTKYYCVECDTFAAYEYANVKFTGTTDSLSSKNIKLNISGESKLNAPEKSTVSLPIPEWSHTFFNDASGSLSAGIANDLSLTIDGDFNRSGGSVSLNSSIMFNGSSSFSLNGKITGTYSKSYSETINVVTVPVVVAGIPIGTIVVPMTYGINTSVSGYGNLAINAGISGQFGFTNSIGVGLTYYTWTIGKGRWKKRFSVPNGINFWANADRTNSIETNKTINMDLRGTAQFTPYVKMGVGFRLFGIAGFTTNATMSLAGSFTSDINYANTGSLAVQAKIVGDVSIGEDICAEISLLYWSKSITKTLAEASIWNKTFLDQTLYLSSTTIPYTLTYSTGTASGGSAPASAIYTRGQTVTAPSNTGNLSRTGYSFAGWNTLSAGSGVSYLPGQSFPMPSYDLILYPLWEVNVYTVTYDINGGTGDIPSTQTIAQSVGKVVSKNANIISSSGCSLSGWTLNSTAGTFYEIGTDIPLTDNVVLYAKYSNLIEYTVIYGANGASGGTAPTESYYSSGSTVTVKDQGTLVWGNRAFLGWNTKKDGTGTGISVGSSLTLSSTVTLYAQWEKYSVFYQDIGTINTAIYSDWNIDQPVDTATYGPGDVVTIKPWSIWLYEYEEGGGPTSGFYKVVTGWFSIDLGTIYRYGDSFTMGSTNIVLTPVYEEGVGWDTVSLYLFK